MALIYIVIRVNNKTEANASEISVHTVVVIVVCEFAAVDAVVSDSVGGSSTNGVSIGLRCRPR